ncbi:MAG: GNAT family N-acetyltransferase [Candidatus Lokiarchaeota archaeon]|nr:GNAT family N-acetyltransferase [Candidatus Lokiarchaeota archaeon]
MNFRLATIEDIPGIIKVSIDTWRTTYREILPTDFLNNLSYEDGISKWQQRFTEPERYIFFYIAETDSKEVIGFALGSLEQSDPTPNIPDINKYIGELKAIYVLKENQRRGIGVRLVKLIAEKLVEQDINSMVVWVLKDNPNWKFYEILGGKYLGQGIQKIGESDYIKIAFGWEDISKILTYKRSI